MTPINTKSFDSETLAALRFKLFFTPPFHRDNEGCVLDSKNRPLSSVASGKTADVLLAALNDYFKPLEALTEEEKDGQ